MYDKLLYYPITATPFKRNKSYVEVVPSQLLIPYIRCFWGTESPLIQGKIDELPELVIPDTCVDIIYHIDYTGNVVMGGFCGINDCGFYANNGGITGHEVSTFAIRFYAWSAYAFVDDTLRATLNGYYDVGSRFEWLDQIIRPRLLELRTLQDKIAFVEKLFIKRLSNVRNNAIIDNSIQSILTNKGSLDISDVAKQSFVSTRQLERLFHEYIGITPKKISNIIRYQFLWRDILCESHFDILNAVYRYGYTDQSHLLRKFKRYHSMDINAARLVALKDVENIQDNNTQA